MRLIIGLMFLFFTVAKGEIKVVTTYPYIASITKEIVKEKGKVESLAEGIFDPHFVVPKPSLTIKLRDADLLVINGAGLEVGWLPPLLNQANNLKINPSSVGFLDLSNLVNLIDKPENTSRAYGDIHPEGNPHFHLNPNNIPILADAITQKLCRLDQYNCQYYKNNYSSFKERWDSKIKEWDVRMSPLRGKKFIQYHKLFDYFLLRYGLKSVGTLELLPGIPPNAKHVDSLIDLVRNEKVDRVLQDVYHPQKPANFISEKTGVRITILPHDVGAVPEAKDIYSLFDEIVKRFTQ
ncbi:MAG: zinc ABC transporter substrate-binding protein [Hydrogenothermaceae bacterium]|nr:zinc ABC transporter substrate-binding protein [Hydrogenothermaceae bacterium]